MYLHIILLLYNKKKKLKHKFWCANKHRRLIVFFAGELSTKEPLDRESRAWHEVIVEARDQDGGIRGRSKRVKVRVTVTDVNDNAPVVVDPQQDVVAVREQQPPGVEVVTVKAADPDQGNNATITYSILKGTCVVRTRRKSGRHAWFYIYIRCRACARAGDATRNNIFYYDDTTIIYGLRGRQVRIKAVEVLGPTFFL